MKQEHNGGEPNFLEPRRETADQPSAEQGGVQIEPISLLHFPKPVDIGQMAMQGILSAAAAESPGNLVTEAVTGAFIQNTAPKTKSGNTDELAK